MRMIKTRKNAINIYLWIQSLMHFERYFHIPGDVELVSIDLQHTIFSHYQALIAVVYIFVKNLILLTVCSCHVTYAFQSESTLYSCLNVKELLARSRREIWNLSDCQSFISSIICPGFESSCPGFESLKPHSID